MSHLNGKFVAALIAVACALPISSLADTAPKHSGRKSRAKAQEPAPLPPYSPHALSPLPLEQLPAVPPEVNYRGGQLTIVAHNSTLGDILRAVHKQTGAEFDIPANANERVVTSLGPGPARDVLATLLNGSHFNYVMIGSPTDPSAVARLVLTTKSGPETASAAPPPPAQSPDNHRYPFAQPMNMPQAQMDQPEPEPAPDDNNADAEENADQADGQDAQADQQNTGQQTPKTPEQLLQELQRQQQQVQQQQQGQPGQPQVVYPMNQPPGMVPNQPPTAVPQQQ